MTLRLIATKIAAVGIFFALASSIAGFFIWQKTIFPDPAQEPAEPILLQYLPTKTLALPAATSLKPAPANDLPQPKPKSASKSQLSFKLTTLPATEPAPKSTQLLKTEVFVSLDCYFQNTTAASRGSGVIVRSDGLILTNRHIATYVEPDGTDRKKEYPIERCEVGLSDYFNQPPEEIYQASLVWSAATMNPKDQTKIVFDYDFAFLKIDKLLISRADCLSRYPNGTELCNKYPDSLPTNFSVVPLGDPSELQINSQITVTGYPSEFSRDNKLFQVAGPITEIYSNIIEAQAPVEKGFSGSAVLNQYNELVGLLVAGKTGSLADFIRLDWIQANNSVLR